MPLHGDNGVKCTVQVGQFISMILWGGGRQGAPGIGLSHTLVVEGVCLLNCPELTEQ